MKKYYLNKDYYCIIGGIIDEYSCKHTGERKELSKEEYEYLKQNELKLDDIKRIELEINKTPIYSIEMWEEGEENELIETFFSIKGEIYNY